jgi:hypothetical protein
VQPTQKQKEKKRKKELERKTKFVASLLEVVKDNTSTMMVVMTVVMTMRRRDRTYCACATVPEFNVLVFSLLSLGVTPHSCSNRMKSNFSRDSNNDGEIDDLGLNVSLQVKPKKEPNNNPKNVAVLYPTINHELEQCGCQLSKLLQAISYRKSSHWFDTFWVFLFSG